MELNQHLWYVRLFFFFKEILEQFCNTTFWSHSKRTNLCFFFWTYILGSVVILAHLALYGYAIWALTGQIVKFYDWSGFFSFYGTIVTALITIVLFFFVVTLLKKATKKAKESLEVIIDTREKEESAPNCPSFISVLMTHLRASKEKFCVNITFTE